jgi:hypothetical protein
MNVMPLAQAVPHPTVKGAWTIEDPLAKPGDHVPMIASKVRAGIIAEKRNENRRPK